MLRPWHWHCSDGRGSHDLSTAAVREIEYTPPNPHPARLPALYTPQVTSPTLVVGNSCRKKNLDPCTCYEFRVRAASAWGWSAHCDPVMVVTLPSAAGGAARGDDASASPRQKVWGGCVVLFTACCSDILEVLFHSKASGACLEGTGGLYIDVICLVCFFVCFCSLGGVFPIQTGIKYCLIRACLVTTG